MLIAQITDLHIGDGPTTAGNAARLETVLDRLDDVQPDLTIITGDLIEAGGVEGYRQLRMMLGRLTAPYLLTLGNHDIRAEFRTAFPDTPFQEGFVQYAHDAGDLRILVLDTVGEGHHGGAFCETRAVWLGERLSEAPETPTLIAMHHPPVASGIGWMDAGVPGDWTRRLERALAGQDQIVGLIAGHIHRPMNTTFAGHRLNVCSSVAPQLALDLTQIRPEQPDARPLIVEEPPALALHLWRDGALTTHFASAAAAPVLARFNDETQPMILSLTGNDA